MNHSPKRVVIFAFGVGGHKAQMSRLVAGLNVNKGKYDTWIAFTDDTKHNQWVDEVVNVSELRSKVKKNKLYFFDNLITTISFYIKMKKEFDDIKLISTGPGHVIPLAALVRLFGGQVLHLETWSRFYSKSLTGVAMYFISNLFYVQNKELVKKYKRAIYSGRL